MALSLSATRCYMRGQRLGLLSGILGVQGGTPVPVHQIQVAPDLKWAYYSAPKILWIQQDDPLAQNPYS